MPTVVPHYEVGGPAPALRLALVVILLFVEMLSVESAAVAEDTSPSDTAKLLQMSFEELGKIQVTTVSKKSESLSGAAAAIYVITQEDIRRSGVTMLPEALRMVPGLDVARANSRQWAISARGFNDIFANKLLVLMDGRTIYTPLFSGVFWEETDTVLEDVDRIEVIRGPGATLWGANAVNGVINIISKSAKETQGTLISGGGGIEERAFGTVRYGGQAATNVYYRVYGKYADHDEFTLRDGGGGAGDNWWTSQGGFRIDWGPSAQNHLTLQGDYHYDDLGGKFFLRSMTSPVLVPANARFKAEGANILGRWTHEFSGESEMSAQMYYDRTDRGFGVGREIRDTVDVDAQHRFHLGDRQEVIWGGGYRFSADNIMGGPDFQVGDPTVALKLASVFLQDDIALVPERLHLTLGTKLEHNDFTGLEMQPSGRVAWTPNHAHTVWGSVSRAVRTPSRLERDFQVFVDPGSFLEPLPIPLLVAIAGNPDFRSEELLAYEIGSRVQLHARLSLDWTAFYNDYDHVRAIAERPFELRVSPSPHLFVPATISNDLAGHAYGTEATVTWQPVDAWRLRAGYSYLEMDLKMKGPRPSVTELVEEGGIAEQQFFLSADADLGRHIEWGVGVRYVDRRPLQTVSSYTALQTRLAWKPTRNCELAIIGRDLLDPHHREFAPGLLSFRRIEVDRAVYAKLTFRF
jgi:iron complex outermembrane receptor protein